MTKLTGIQITKKQFAADYTAITGPGMYKGVKATGQNNEFYNENIARVNDKYSHSFLVNLKAVEASKIPAILALFDGRDSVDLGELSKLTMVASVHVNEGQADPNLPFKNQEITIQTDWAIDKTTGERLQFINKETGEELGDILNVIGIKVPEATKAVSFASLFNDVKDESLEVSFEEEEKPKVKKATAKF